MSKNKIYIYTACISFILLVVYALSQPRTKEDSVKLLQYADHPALDATREGVADYLNQCCNIQVQSESAQGNPVMALQIASKFISKRPEAIVAIGTVAAQSFINQTKIIPVVYASVTDPIAAHLVKTAEKSQTNFAGVSNYVDVKSQLKLYKQILPNLKKLGMIYNPGEVNSTTLVEEMQRESEALGIELVHSMASTESEAILGAENLASKVDAIVINNDNNALSAIANIISVADEHELPVLCSDVDTINMGVLTALGPDQYTIGKQAGQIVEHIIKGDQSPQEMPILYPDSVKLHINLSVADRLNIEIPQTIRRQAKCIG